MIVNIWKIKLYKKFKEWSRTCEILGLKRCLNEEGQENVSCQSVNSVLMVANSFKPVKFHVSN